MENFFPREHPIRIRINIIEEQFDKLNEPWSKLEVSISLSSIVYMFFLHFRQMPGIEQAQ
jgi:hypothetical protein